MISRKTPVKSSQNSHSVRDNSKNQFPLRKSENSMVRRIKMCITRMATFGARANSTFLTLGSKFIFGPFI